MGRSNAPGAAGHSRAGVDPRIQPHRCSLGPGRSQGPQKLGRARPKGRAWAARCCPTVPTRSPLCSEREGGASHRPHPRPLQLQHRKEDALTECLAMVHALGQNRAEGDGGQGLKLLAHRPDLQKSSERYGEGGVQITWGQHSETLLSFGTLTTTHPAVIPRGPSRLQKKKRRERI